MKNQPHREIHIWATFNSCQWKFNDNYSPSRFAKSCIQTIFSYIHACYIVLMGFYGNDDPDPLKYPNSKLYFWYFSDTVLRNAGHSCGRRGEAALLRSTLGRTQGQVGVEVGGTWVKRDRYGGNLSERTLFKFCWKPCWTEQLWGSAMIVCRLKVLGFSAVYACRSTSVRMYSWERECLHVCIFCLTAHVHNYQLALI